jgi:bisphosphoglycerate-independent phosphoglycerate mutase (AlkP superfamily)
VAGMLAMAGPHVSASGGLGDAGLEDIAPTVLQLLGVDAPANISGRSLL